MGTPGHIVINMGKTVVHLRRHWGTAASTGVRLLQLLQEVPSLQERSHFHLGGYLIRELLDARSPMADLPLTKGSFVQCDFEISDGLDNTDTDYGYEIRAVRELVHDPKYDEPYYGGDVTWELRYTADYLGDMFTYEEWIGEATLFTYRGLAERLLEETYSGPLSGHNPDYLKELRIALNRCLENVNR